MPSQSLTINDVQYLNPKGNQQSDGKKKGLGKKKYKDMKRNVNKPNNNAREVKNESKKKVKFPFKLCNGYNLTHICANIQDAQHLLAQQGSSSS